MRKAIFAFVALLPVIVTGPSAQDCTQAIIDDMTLPPDAALHGTEGMSWGTGEASPQPMPSPVKNNQGAWMQAMTNWGQTYIPRDGSTATNTRCQIRNVITKLLRKDGSWEQVQSGNPSGAAFVENFANNAAIDAGARDESNNGGGVSVIVGVGAWAGHNFHFWSSSGRAVVDTNNTVAVFTQCEARLIVDDPAKPDDRASCKNVLQMGADWWLNLTAGWDPCWCNNFGIGGGRAKWVTADWQSFSMCTLTPDQIRSNPPCSASVTPPVATPIPARIEAESYSAMSGVATESTSDAGGGLDVGWIDTGDWMDYFISVPAAGNYEVDFRAASPGSGSQLQVKSGATVLTTVNIPATGGYQNWQTVSSIIALTAGAQIIRIYAATGGWNLNWVEFKTAAATSVAGHLPSSGVPAGSRDLRSISLHAPVTGTFDVRIYAVSGREVGHAIGTVDENKRIALVSPAGLARGSYPVTVDAGGREYRLRAVVMR